VRARKFAPLCAGRTTRWGSLAVNVDLAASKAIMWPARRWEGKARAERSFARHPRAPRPAELKASRACGQQLLPIKPKAMSSDHLNLGIGTPVRVGSGQ
jgi:hypothetical protein